MAGEYRSSPAVLSTAQVISNCRLDSHRTYYTSIIFSFYIPKVLLVVQVLGLVLKTRNVISTA